MIEKKGVRAFMTFTIVAICPHCARVVDITALYDSVKILFTGKIIGEEVECGCSETFIIHEVTEI